MRHSFIICGLIATVFLFCQDAQAQNFVWSGGAGTLLLKRERPDDATILVDFFGDEIFNASQFDFDMEAGILSQLGLAIDETHFFQLQHFSIHDFSSQQFVTSFDGIDFNTIPTVGEGGPRDADLHYTSKLDSIELMYLHQCNDWLRAGGGYRWLQLNEALHGGISDGFGGYDGIFGNHVQNNLHGFQGMVDILLAEGDQFWSINAVAKAGIYGNAASNHSWYTGWPPAHGHTTEAAFVGELGVNSTWQLTDWIDLVVSYQMLWLEGVATASDQVLVTNYATGHGASADGGVFFHGVGIYLTITPR